MRALFAEHGMVDALFVMSDGSGRVVVVVGVGTEMITDIRTLIDIVASDQIRVTLFNHFTKKEKLVLDLVRRTGTCM